MHCSLQKAPPPPVLPLSLPTSMTRWRQTLVSVRAISFRRTYRDIFCERENPSIGVADTAHACTRPDTQSLFCKRLFRLCGAKKQNSESTSKRKTANVAQQDKKVLSCSVLFVVSSSSSSIHLSFVVVWFGYFTNCSRSPQH
jgi:hypothetical protein